MLRAGWSFSIPPDNVSPLLRADTAAVSGIRGSILWPQLLYGFFFKSQNQIFHPKVLLGCCTPLHCWLPDTPAFYTKQGGQFFYMAK